MYFAVIALSLFACVLGAPSIEQRLVGGKPASKGQFPYQASLQFKSGGVVFSEVCGAVIISPSWALTAASCRDSFDLSRYRVASGLLNQGENGGHVQIRSIEEFILHPKYNGAKHINNIALLLFTEPLQWTDTVKRAKLPADGQDVSGQAVIASWGRGKTLEWASLNVNSDCQGATDQNQICTADDSVVICSNDAGNGLVQGSTVVGLMSHTTNSCGTPGGSVVYTKVSGYNDFIREHVFDL